MKRILNFINGEFVQPVAGKYLSVVDPAVGAQYAVAAASTKDDINAAVAAAKTAFPRWSSLSGEQRAEFLIKISEGILRRSEELALAESIDNGKPLSVARSVDIPRAAKNMRFFAEAITQFSGEAFATDDQTMNYVVRHPLGVVACISPWNLPLYLFTWKIAPALAAGNCVVGKPSEITPMTASILGEICKEAGLPQGVLNIVQGYGSEAGAALVEHPDIAAISFTGGTQTGKYIAQIAAKNLKKVSLELGGKNPTIIFDDCNYEKAVATAVQAAFSNQGQICLCGSRIYVHSSIYEKFKLDFVERVKALQVGDPLVESTKIGAVVSSDHWQKILAYIELAESEGGTILCGGKHLHPDGRCSEGFFIAPTVIDGLHDQCRVNQEEIFGPVVTLQPFETEAEAIRLANGTKYGLAASIWTNNFGKAHRVAQAIESGIVWVNCWMVRDLRTPFGGVKESGMGREGGMEALKFFTEPTNICLRF